MNDALRQAAVVDPDWARKEWRRRIVLISVTVGALVAIAVGTIALVIGVHNQTEITQVQHSACQSEPAGRECQQAKAESSRAANLYVTCIPFRKAGYECPKPGSAAAKDAAARDRSAGSASAPVEVGSHPASAPANPGATGPSAPHHATAPAGGGNSHTAAPSHPHHPAPGGPAPETAPTPPPGEAPRTEPEQHQPPEGGGGSESSPPPPSPGNAPGLVEEVGGVVEGTGSAAGGVVESVGKTGCAVLGNCK